MRLFYLLFYSCNGFYLFQPIYDQIINYGKAGLIDLITNVKESDVWQRMSFSEEVERQEEIDNLIADLELASNDALINYIIEYEYIAGRTHHFLQSSMNEIAMINQPAFSPKTDAYQLMILFFESDHFSKDQEESLAEASEHFLKILDSLHAGFNLELDDPVNLLTNFLEDVFNFYVIVKDVFEITLQNQLNIAVDAINMIMGVYGEIKRSKTEYTSLISWMNICLPQTSIFDYVGQWVSYLEYLTPRWIDVSNELILFLIGLQEMFPILNFFKFELITHSQTELIEGILEDSKRTVSELELVAKPFGNLIDNSVEQYFC